MCLLLSPMRVQQFGKYFYKVEDSGCQHNHYPVLFCRLLQGFHQVESIRL